MATKNEIQATVEGIVETLVAQFGGEIVKVTQPVGGKTQQVKKVKGGVFDLDAARSLVMASIVKNKVKILKDAIPALPTPAAIADSDADGDDTDADNGDGVGAATNGLSLVK